jgi:hypothetical protein
VTLLQAIANASKAGVKICHPLIEGSRLIPVQELEQMRIPVVVAASNEWELEARTCHINEHTAKNTFVHVLRKYISGNKIDELADALVAEFFTEHV